MNKNYIKGGLLNKHEEAYQLSVWRDRKPTFSQQDQLPMGTYQGIAVQRTAFLHMGAA